MGGLIQAKKPSGKGITIDTQSVDPNGAGFVKKSTVRVEAVKQPFFMGVRIGSKQEITELTFDTVNVLDRKDAATTKALEKALPIPAGVPEQWKGFALGADDLAHPGEFQTRFGLSSSPEAGKFQLVPFVVAQTLDDFASGSYLVTVSVVTSPSDVGPVELPRR